jgi:hypothetical protein
MLLLVLASLLLAVKTVLNVRGSGRHNSKWALLSFGFMFMAYDEAFSVHELLNAPMAKLLGGKNLGIFYFAWVIPGMALAVFLGLFLLKFLFHLDGKTRRRFVTAGAVYLTGAVGFELIGGHYAEINGWDYNLPYTIIATIEEVLEIAGILIFIEALIENLAESRLEIRFLLPSQHLDRPKPENPPLEFRVENRPEKPDNTSMKLH